MPLYDYKCQECSLVTEAIRPSSVSAIHCPECQEAEKRNLRLPTGVAVRQLSVPASFRFPDMGALNKRRQRITNEPVWRDQETGKVSSMY